MEKLSEKQIKTAVDWWAGAIQNPKFDNGDDSRSGGMSMILATLARTDVSQNQLESFKRALTEAIQENTPRHISVDYGPDMLLGAAMEKAGIPSNMAPWKTTMWLISDGVSVRHGYRAETQNLIE